MNQRIRNSIRNRNWIIISRMACLLVFFSGLLVSSDCLGQRNRSKQDSQKKELSETEKLKLDQENLAKQYKLLEEKLFSLYEFEQDTNPIRSRLLQRAFQQSQEKMTAAEMHTIVQFLDKAKLKNAEKEQEQVLKDLVQLLDLLQSEDRGKRVRDEIQRNQEYLKEVERLLRIQKGIRGQSQGGVDSRRLARSQEKAAE